jgi:uncharacterized membrane protein YczE
MNEKFMKNYYLRIFLYVFGIMVLGLGINVLLRSTLGAGAWDTVSNNFSILINSTIGTASIIINITVLLFVVIYNKHWKYLSILLPIFSLGFVIDFWDIIVFGDYTVDAIWLQVIFYVSGAIILSLGLSLIIVSRYPAMVYDELTVSLMRLFKIKKFFTMRIMIELFAILLATLFGFLASIGFGAVNVGSFILAVALGPIITLHMKWLNALLKTEKIS